MLANGVSSLLQRFLYGINPIEPSIVTTVATVLIGVGILASLLPVLHVMRLDPAKVLRSE